MAYHQSLEADKRNAGLRRPDPDAGALSDMDTTSHPLLTLQRQVGNAQVARMLAQREAAPDEDDDKIQMKRDTDLQRAADDEDDEIQMKRDVPEVGLEGGPISDALSGRIQAKKGAGTSLDAGTRTTMESQFGTSFEDVRVHSDGESGALNRSLGAKAFTTGSDIFLGQGTSPGDHSLMAHELTHVVQQRSMSGSGPMTVGPAGDSYEQEADTTASAISSGAAGAAAQRQAEEE